MNLSPTKPLKNGNRAAAIWPYTNAPFPCRGKILKRLQPFLLDLCDHPTIEEIRELYLRSVGRRRRYFQQNFFELISTYSPHKRQVGMIVRQYLDGFFYSSAGEVEGGARRIRQKAYLVASRLSKAHALQPQGLPRANAQLIADELGMSRARLVEAIFADFPNEAMVTIPDRIPDNDQIRLGANLLALQLLVKKAHLLVVRAPGLTRPIIRHAKFRGLICQVFPSESHQDSPRIEISGPLAVIKRTRIYGQHLAELLGYLPQSANFHATALIQTDQDISVLTLNSMTRFAPGKFVRHYDSRLEEQFAASFLAETSSWDLIREPKPVNVNGHLIFPDFAIYRRLDPKTRFLVEIVGFWTPDYLSAKIRDYQTILEPTLLLIPCRASIADNLVWPKHVQVIRYKTKIPIAEVIALLR